MPAVFILCPSISSSGKTSRNDYLRRLQGNLRLDDHLGSYRKVERQLRQALDELTEVFKDLNFTIEF
jgi:hypothetical protein